MNIAQKESVVEISDLRSHNLEKLKFLSEMLFHHAWHHQISSPKIIKAEKDSPCNLNNCGRNHREISELENTPKTREQKLKTRVIFLVFSMGKINRISPQIVFSEPFSF